MMLYCLSGYLHPLVLPPLEDRPLRYREIRIGERADRYRYYAWKSFVFIENGRAAGSAEEIGRLLSASASSFPLIVRTVHSNAVLAKPSLDTECAASAPLTFKAMANRDAKRLALTLRDKANRCAASLDFH